VQKVQKKTGFAPFLNHCNNHYFNKLKTKGAKVQEFDPS